MHIHSQLYYELLRIRLVELEISKQYKKQKIQWQRKTVKTLECR